jgi:hypothetical protein
MIGKFSPVPYPHQLASPFREQLRKNFPRSLIVQSAKFHFQQLLA